MQIVAAKMPLEIHKTPSWGGQVSADQVKCTRRLLAKSASRYLLPLLVAYIIASKLNTTPIILANCDTICPPDTGPIYPCTCQNGTQGLLLKCTRSNLATLAGSLRNLHPDDPVEQLEIEHSNIGRLFGPLFGDSTLFRFHSTLRELDVRASGLRFVQAASFSRQLLAGVQYLMLDRNLLEQAPTELANNMTNLRLLNLSSNSISVLEPNSFAKLTNLTELDLSNNKISRLARGAFNSLASLEYLNLAGNELGKLEKSLFAFGRRLRHLDLSNNKLTSLDRQDLSELTALETLRLAQNQLTTVPRSIFSRNAKLYQLDLSFNKLEDIDTYLFKSTRFLKELNMAGNLIKEITKNTFSPTTRIKRIDLSQNLIAALAPETFKGLEWLERIDLSHNQIVNISNDAFSRIFQVEIDLSFNKLQRIFYWSFHEVANMSKLDLSNNLLSEGISQIAFESTDCAHLDLSYNQIQDISKVPVSNLTGIRVLNISHNQITEFNKKSFTQKVPLYELHTIDASYNNISQISGNVLERLKSIRHLDLSYNSLRRLTSGSFGNSPTLLELNLSHNNLVEIVAGTLVGLVSLKNLELAHNRLKKMIPVPVAVNSIHLEHNEIGHLSRSAFPSLNSLLELYLDHNRIGHLDEGTFATLLALHTLELSNNNLSAIPAAALKDLSSLQNLRLDGNNIQSLGRRAFGVLPIVFNLRLDRNNISTLADHAFEGMLQLLNLNLSYNRISELPPESFAGLVSLRSLDLSNNQLTRFENKSRSAMEDLLSLEVVNFSSNKLSLITPRTFLNSPYIPYRLTHLDLSNNLVGILVQHFALGLKKVEWLSLRNNIINEIQPSVLGNITHLRHLDLSHNKLRQLKEGTLGGGSAGGAGHLLNLTTLLLNNNKLTHVHWPDVDKLRSLERLNLAANRLERLPNETNRWIMSRGLALDLSQNAIECTCAQLPLIAWIDGFRFRNSSSLMPTVDMANNAANNNNNNNNNNNYNRANNRRQLNAKLFDQYSLATQLVAGIQCAKPDTMSGKSIMQMPAVISGTTPASSSSPSPSVVAVVAAPVNDLNCDKDLIERTDQLRRLKAPVQLIGAEPYYLGGQQHLQVGWSVLDPRIDLQEFVLVLTQFQQPFELPPMITAGGGGGGGQWATAANYQHSLPLLRDARQRMQQQDNHDAKAIQVVEQTVERVAYNERTHVIRNLNPRQFYVICITYSNSSGHQLASSTLSGNGPPTTTMIDHQKQQSSLLLGTTTATAANGTAAAAADQAGRLALFANLMSDYNQVNCVSLDSLLRKATSERLISGAQTQLAITTTTTIQLNFILTIFMFQRLLWDMNG